MSGKEKLVRGPSSSRGDVEMGSFSGNKFSITLDDIADMNENRSLEKLAKLGGVDGVAAGLRSSTTNGIDLQEEDTQFSKRRERYGVNLFPPAPSKTFWELFKAAMDDQVLLLLVVAAFISIGLSMIEEKERATGWVDGVAILVAVLLVSGVTALNDYQKERQFRALNDVKNDYMVKVKRGGEDHQVSVFEINVGDLVVLHTGDQIPADGLYVEGDELRTSEAVMTGETDEVKKGRDTDPFLLSGCQVANGTGAMIVTAIGPDSEWGKILMNLRTEEEDTPLQEKLEELVVLIGKIGMAVAVVVFVILTVRFIVHESTSDEDWKWSKISKIGHAFIIAVTIVVVAVPEGLPLAVTISLAYSMKKMMKDNNLVRHLAACETMGGATTICSDKTGTLTTNRMTVVSGWMGGSYHANVDTLAEQPQQLRDDLSEGIAVNSQAFIEIVEQGEPNFVGNKTECALLVLSAALGSDYNDIRKKVKKLKIVPFSSKTKKMTTVVEKSRGVRLYTKGASERVLDLCSHYDTPDGRMPLSDDVREEIADAINQMATEGKRTLCLAYTDLDANLDFSDTSDYEHDLTCQIVVGIRDPVRKEVPDAVLRCQRAGILVRMVTGDNITTAKSIAKQCGILSDGGIAMEGPSFRKLAEEELEMIIPRLQVLARSSPEDKLKLVNKLRSMGEVVAVTGDGTNDGPALRSADVGLSMGIAGTAVAKEASDVVIMDDNFSSIVAAVKWGRSVYDNIRKFVQFQVTVNIVALTVAFVASIEEKTPLEAIHLLWINLIMDTLAALALGTEPPTDSLLERKPHGRHTQLISRRMWKNIAIQSTYQVFIVLLIFFSSPTLWLTNGKLEEFCATDSTDSTDSTEVTRDEACEAKHEIYHHAFLFNVFVFCQVFNELNCRKVYDEINIFSGMFQNFYFVGILFVICALQVMFMQVGQDAFKTYPLDAGEWLKCVGLASVTLPLGFIARLIPITEAEDEEEEGPSSGNSGSGKKDSPASNDAFQSALAAKELEVEALKGALKAKDSELEAMRGALKAKDEEVASLRILRYSNSP